MEMMKWLFPLFCRHFFAFFPLPVRIMLASGEHVSPFRHLPDALLLPVPKIVGDDHLLHSQLVQCHSRVNELIAGRLLHLRNLLNRCHGLPCFDAHDTLESDLQMRYLENVVHAFVTKWSQRIARWSYDMAGDEYVREVNSLFEDVADFNGTLSSVEKYVQSASRVLQQYLRQFGMPEPEPRPSTAELPHSGLLPSSPTLLLLLGYLSRIGCKIREFLESAVILGGACALFGLGAYFGLSLQNHYF